MGPTWVLLAPGGPHVGPINLAIRDGSVITHHRLSVCWSILLMRVSAHVNRSMSDTPTREVNSPSAAILYRISWSFCRTSPGGLLDIKMLSYQCTDPHVKDDKNPLHLDVVDRYLRQMGDKTIPNEARLSLESFYSPMSHRYRSTTIKVLWILCLVHQ